MKVRPLAAWLLGPALLAPAAVHAAPVASAPTRQATAEQAPADRLLSLDEARRHYRGPLAQKVLAFLTVMDRVVNKEKQPAITPADWEPLGELVDRQRFRRVGNFGVKNDWTSYAGLLTSWARSSWWKGYIWRLREVPATPGQPGLVYLESEERSSQKHPVTEGGEYSTLASIAVYEFDAAGRITRLHVYDQRPL
jgi:hypothetical protein